MITIPIWLLVVWFVGWAVSVLILDFVSEHESGCMTYVGVIMLAFFWPAFLIVIIWEYLKRPR